jgi:type IV conjugative transfer system protein TraL
MSSERKYIINQGLDYPDIIGFWEINELIIASFFCIIFILMQAIIVGILVCFIVLYFLQSMKDHYVRGKQDHFLWKIGLLQGKGFERFPPASATRFEY